MSREACSSALSKALGKDSTTSSESADSLAHEIESQIYAKHGSDSAEAVASYKNEIRSKLNNLNSNDELRQRLLAGSVSPQALADMTPEEMATKEKRAENEAIRQEQTEDVIMVNTLKPNSTIEGGEDLDSGIVRHTGQDGIEYDAP